ncbi:MAG TPA: ribonuclease III domain-containing protein [Stenomitos sp.]
MKDWRELSPRLLAYMGDAVYELHVRSRLMTANVPVERLHTAKVSRVRASAQAAALRRLLPTLTEDEQDVVRRARNLKSNVPKNASVADYRYSTAFEALLGMLYLQGATERLDAILRATDALLETSDEPT